MIRLYIQSSSEYEKIIEKYDKLRFYLNNNIINSLLMLSYYTEVEYVISNFDYNSNLIKVVRKKNDYDSDIIWVFEVYFVNRYILDIWCLNKKILITKILLIKTLIIFNIPTDVINIILSYFWISDIEYFKKLRLISNNKSSNLYNIIDEYSYEDINKIKNIESKFYKNQYL